MRQSGYSVALLSTSSNAADGCPRFASTKPPDASTPAHGSWLVPLQLHEAAKQQLVADGSLGEEGAVAPPVLAAIVAVWLDAITSVGCEGVGV
jgi:hypothetical protein